MAILFISDVHLAENESEITQHFIALLDEAKTKTESIYILGDLFDRWIGDDDLQSWQQPVIAALQSVTQRIPCYFIAGNRDFLLGSAFCERTGLTLLQEPMMIDLYGKKTLLMHGDLLCIDDKKYQAYRITARNPQAIQRFLWLPLFLRKAVAYFARCLSKFHQKKQQLAILDANQDEILRQLDIHNADLLIYGHTHQPGIHWYRIGNQFKCWIVLGDWHNGHYRVLWASADRLELRSTPKPK
ncbi:MAG: UDP-2,3-diacylglucosamine diphosphatase [Legionellales bacterium]|nr:UDP-2,3-diacylglucosamine diphosphatase [Legionellales bacterium]